MPMWFALRVFRNEPREGGTVSGSPKGCWLVKVCWLSPPFPLSTPCKIHQRMDLMGEEGDLGAGKKMLATISLLISILSPLPRGGVRLLCKPGGSRVSKRGGKHSLPELLFAGRFGDALRVRFLNEIVVQIMQIIGKGFMYIR